MKVLMMFSCVLLYAGSIQSYSVVPQSRFGLEPPSGAYDFHDNPKGNGRDVADDVREVIIRTETKPDTGALVQTCIDMFVNGEIQLPSSTSMHPSTPIPSTPTTSTTTTTTTQSTTSGTKTAKSSTAESTPETNKESSTKGMSTSESTTKETTVNPETRVTIENMKRTSSTSVPAATTTTQPGPAILFSCNFEFGWCGIQQDMSFDHFNWTMADSPSPSALTGPDRAYSGTHYIFIEASSPVKANEEAATPEEKAEFLLPSLCHRVESNAPSGGERCLRFKYHMYGFHIRELKVYMERSHDPTGVEPSSDASGVLVSRWELFSIRGEQGNMWQHAEISLYMECTDRIGFLGIRGEEFSGDIALDDIIVTSGYCDNHNIQQSGSEDPNEVK